MTAQFVKLLILICSLGKIVLCEEILINLESYKPETSKTEYREYTNVSDTRTEIKVTNIDPGVEFFIIQVHTYAETVTLSYTPNIKLHSHVNGTNIGLFWDRSIAGENYTDNVSFYCIRNLAVKKRINILVAIHVYGENDPIPGGCNMSFETMIAPYQKTNYTNSMITVISQPPSTYGMFCNKNPVQTVTYHMFLEEYENAETNYFDGIVKMMSVERIKQYGRVVHKGSSSQYKRFFNLYAGTGEVFAIVATYQNRSSAYVPAVSFGCDLTKWDEDCVGPSGGLWKLACACLLLFGIFVCIWGHRFFKISLFAISCMLGLLCTYSIFAGENTYSSEGIAKGIFMTFAGILFAVAWVYIWWKCGVPILSVSLSFILAAIIMASVVFYMGLADYEIFDNDIIYWLTFGCLILAFLITWSALTLHSHVFALSLIGSFSAVVAMNYYVGGNLQYIIINTYRRLTVHDFNKAVIDPPFQGLDIGHIVLWICLLSLGCVIQLRHQIGRAPFPPHNTATAPLLPPRSVTVYYGGMWYD